jgi:hypothetical protein
MEVELLETPNWVRKTSTAVQRFHCQPESLAKKERY